MNSSILSHSVWFFGCGGRWWAEDGSTPRRRTGGVGAGRAAMPDCRHDSPPDRSACPRCHGGAGARRVRPARQRRPRAGGRHRLRSRPRRRRPGQIDEGAGRSPSGLCSGCHAVGPRRRERGRPAAPRPFHTLGQRWPIDIPRGGNWPEGIIARPRGRCPGCRNSASNRRRSMPLTGLSRKACSRTNAGSGGADRSGYLGGHGFAGGNGDRRPTVGPIGRRPAGQDKRSMADETRDEATGRLRRAQKIAALIKPRPHATGGGVPLCPAGVSTS